MFIYHKTKNNRMAVGVLNPSTSKPEIISEVRFPSYIFAVGGAGKRVVLGMFGYEYDRRSFRDRPLFEWLVSSLIRTNKNYSVFIFDTETNNKQRDIEICNEMNNAVGEVRNRHSGYNGNIVFRAINLEPITGYNYETIGGKNSIDVTKRYILENKYGKYYWINTLGEEYGDVDPEIFKKVNDLFSINTLELSAGVQRNRAVTKALWYYFLRNMGNRILPDLRNERIAIFGGLGGGTGSTLIIELSKRYFPQNEVYIFGILPAINGESQQSNTCGYITLTELERLSITNPEFRNHTHVILIPLNFISEGISIPTSGEVQDSSLREEFPLSVLYLILGIFRLVTGGEHALMPAGVDFKLARPFILAPTYLIEVIGSSKIEEDFKNIFTQIKEGIKELGQFMRKSFEIHEDFSGEPKLETYIELNRLFKSELSLIERIVDLYKGFGSRSAESLVRVIKEGYIEQLRRYFVEIEQVVEKFGINETGQKELFNKNLNYYPVYITTHRDILPRMSKFEFSDLDKLFFEVLEEWIKNLKDIVNNAKKIEQFISDLNISNKFLGLLFLGSEKTMVDDFLSDLQLQTGNIIRRKEELELEIKKLSNFKSNLIQAIKSSKELDEIVREISNFRREKEILCNLSIIENFRIFMQEFLKDLDTMGKQYILKYEGNLSQGAIAIENEIKLRNTECSRYIEDFLRLLEIAQKYDTDRIITRNSYSIQLIRAFTYRYHSLMSKRILGIFGGSSEHREKKAKIEAEFRREYNEGFALLYLNPDGKLDVALTVRGRPLIDYLEEITRSKQKYLEGKAQDILNKMNITITIDLSELKLDSTEDLISKISSTSDVEITRKQEELDKLSSKLAKYQKIREFCIKLEHDKYNIFRGVKELQEKLGRSQQELCSQYPRPRLKYTITIQRRGKLNDLLRDEETCRVLTGYLGNQINCYLNNHSLYLGYRECPIRNKDIGISFDRVFLLLGTPAGSRDHLINRRPLVEAISREIYAGGDFNLNYRPENANVLSYDITKDNIISIAFLFVGVFLENISWIENYYRENFKNMYTTAGDAIYIKYVDGLEEGKFYVRELAEPSKISEIYVKNDLLEINKKILDYYKERSYLLNKNRDMIS